MGTAVKVTTLYVHAWRLSVKIGGCDESQMHKRLSKAKAVKWAQIHLGPFKAQPGEKMVMTRRRSQAALMGMV
jgi:hypothetical protein